MMIKNLSIICSSFFILTSYSFKAQNLVNYISLSSEIKNITIHNVGAHIERIGNATINLGSNQLIITNLDPSLINQSIQFVMNSNNIIVNSVSKKMNYLTKYSQGNKELSFLKDSLNHIKEQKRIKEVNLEVFLEEKDLFNENKSVLKTTREFIVDDLMDLSEYFKKSIYRIQSDISFTKKEIDSLSLEEEKLKKQINYTIKAIKNQSANIIVQLTCTKEGNYSYKLSYNSNKAGWAPSYDIRSKGINSPIDLTYKAKIFQNTNETWSNVQLSLSTGKLNKSNKAPSFQTQYVNTYSTNTKRAKTIVKKGYSAAMESEDEIQESISSSEFTSVDYSGTQIIYNISLPYSIPSQTEPVFIEIQKFSLEANYDYYCYPKLDKDVFLMCHFESLGNKNLLPGNGQVYFEGKSVGKTFLDPYSTKKTNDLSLSRDVSIICERTLEKKFSSETKVGDNIKFEKTYKLSLKNNKNQSVSIVLIDQVPKSNKKSIDIQLIESSEAMFNKKNGKLRWNIQLSPNQMVEKKFSFTVKHPSENKVSGF
jgi:uncharacterized protein (TIGR02231 family)